MDATTPAALRWRRQLQSWAIPDHILRDAPADPHHFSVSRFSALAQDALRQPPTPTQRCARARLPAGGSVLDVGCGGGAGSLPLAPPAGLLIGVDQSAGMLEVFAHGASARDVPAIIVQGTWPEVADATQVADVVVCLHVVYNVADLEPFTRALTAHARARVVLELPTHHPLTWLTPYWEQVHGVDRPAGPTSDDALAVFAGLGVDVHSERWSRRLSLHDDPRDEQVAFIRTRLALGPERDGDIGDLVRRIGVPRQRDVVTAWWDV
jgi:SAM-dependent methyltransferase